jgi:haloalkane dehalogenase
VPTLPTDPSLRAQADAWAFFEQFEKPFLCLFTADDPVTLGADKPFIAKVPGAAGLNHQVFERGGHFLQERRYHELSQAITDLVQST